MTDEMQKKPAGNASGTTPKRRLEIVKITIKNQAGEVIEEKEKKG